MLSQFFYSLSGREGVIALNTLGSLAILGAMWRYLQGYTSTAIASICLFACIFLFATNYMTLAGNYNFFTPYKCSALWGLLFSVACFLSIGFARKSGNFAKSLFALSGFFFCLTFLSKQEHFAALGIATFCYFILSIRKPEFHKELLPFLFGSFASLAAFLIWFRLYSNSSFMEIINWISHPYLAIFTTNITQQRLYESLFGLNSDSIFKDHLVSLMVFPLSLYLCHWISKRNPKESLTLSLVSLALLPLLTLFSHSFFYFVVQSSQIYLGIPIFLVMAAFILLVKNRTLLFSGKIAFEWSFLVFSAALCLKIFLSYQLSHYGFSLGPPAFICFLLLVYFLTNNKKLEKETQFLSPAFIFLMAIVFSQGIAQQKAGGYLRDLKPIKVNAQSSTFHTDQATAIALFHVTQELKEILSDPKATITILPEGNFYNWAIQRASPLRYLSLYPDQFLLNSESEILLQMKNQPADYILFNLRDLKEYGFSSFDQTYGKNVADWVKSNYTPVSISKNRSEIFQELGMSIWKKNF